MKKRKVHKDRNWDVTYLCGLYYAFGEGTSKWSNVTCKNCLRLKGKEAR